jgi:hypothetical protein
MIATVSPERDGCGKEIPIGKEIKRAEEERGEEQKKEEAEEK